MKLIFLIQKNAWFIEHANAWYRLHDKQQIALASSCLPLNVVNQYTQVEQPHQAGSAWLSQERSNKLTLALKSPDNKLIETINVPLDATTVMSIDWHTVRYPDGWILPDAKVTLDNVGEMYVDAYLPPSKDSDGKELKIENTATGDVRTIWISRDRKTRFPLLEKNVMGKHCLNLSCIPEPVQNSSDARQLGFLLVTEEAHPVK